MNRDIKLGYECYVFTNWGVCRARVNKIIESEQGTQYQVNIDIDNLSLNKKCPFYYVEDELFNTVEDAIKDVSPLPKDTRYV